MNNSRKEAERRMEKLMCSPGVRAKAYKSIHWKESGIAHIEGDLLADEGDKEISQYKELIKSIPRIEDEINKLRELVHSTNEKAIKLFHSGHSKLEKAQEKWEKSKKLLKQAEDLLEKRGALSSEVSDDSPPDGFEEDPIERDFLI